MIRPKSRLVFLAVAALSVLGCLGDRPDDAAPLPTGSGDPLPPVQPVTAPASAPRIPVSPPTGSAAVPENPDGSCTERLLLCEPLSAFPQTIKETGLFDTPPDFSKRPERVVLFQPDPPLWTDGLRKMRFIVLPSGTTIDNSVRGEWKFPVGTIMAKHFIGDLPAGGDHPIETRFVRRKSETEFDYAVYIWNAAGTEADLAKNEGGNRIPVPARLGAQGEYTHTVPSQNDCNDCHRENSRLTGTFFVGFDETRLNSKLNPSDTKTQLETLAEQGFFTSPLPPEPAQIVDADPLLQRVKRFVFGNCVHCHNGKRIEDFSPNVFVDNVINKPPDASGITVPPGFMRVVPGNPEMSVVYLQTRGIGLPDGFKPMPPIGVQFPPADELTAMRQWIEGL